MKNTKLLNSFLTLVILSGCSIFNNSSSIIEESSSNISSSKIPIENTSSSSKEVNNNILIEYCYKDGTCFDKVEMKGEINQEYNFKSPSINFMTPDIDEINFTLTDEKYYQMVTYDYSNEPTRNVDKNHKFTPFMASEEYGLSLSYIYTKNSEYQSEIFTNEIFNIYLDQLIVADNNEIFNFNISKAIKSNNASLNEMFIEQNDSMYITISFNKDYSIDIYKDGILCYSLLSSMLSTNNEDINFKVKDLVKKVLTNIESDGFSVLNNTYTIKNLIVSEAIDKVEAYELYSSNIHTKIIYVDEYGNEIFDDKNIFDNGGTSYEYVSPKLNHYTVDKEKVNGQTYENKIEKVTYTFDGQELITNEMKNNKTNILDHTNEINWKTQNWFKLARNIEGDFILRTNYHLNGTSSNSTTRASDCCYRTNLTIIEDSNTLDRFVTRLDWCGWRDDVNQDGVKLGKNSNYGSSYFDNYDFDVYGVYSNAEITQTIIRSGGKVTIDYIIVPKNKGYENIVYYHSCSLEEVTSSKLNINFAAEDAKVTFNSIKLKAL